MTGPKSLSTELRQLNHTEGTGEALRHLLAMPVEGTRSAGQEFATWCVWRGVSDSIVRRDEIDRFTEYTRAYAGQESFKIQMPDDTTSIPPEFKSCMGEFQRPKPALYEFSTAKLLWDGSVALTEDNCVILEASENTESHLQHRLRQAIDRHGLSRVTSGLRGDVGRKFHTDRPALLLIRHSSTNFYHYITEYLPKLAALDAYEHQTGDNAVVLLESDPPTWVTESLRLMGLEGSDWVEWGDESATVKQFLIPQHRARTPGIPPLPSPKDCRYVRQAILKRTERKKFPKQVFVSRQDADDRRIDNRESVESLLHDFGFGTYVLGEMSLEDQVSLFSQAEVVVAPHGAGLTHLLFGHDRLN